MLRALKKARWDKGAGATAVELSGEEEDQDEDIPDAPPPASSRPAAEPKPAAEPELCSNSSCDSGEGPGGAAAGRVAGTVDGVNRVLAFDTDRLGRAFFASAAVSSASPKPSPAQPSSRAVTSPKFPTATRSYVWRGPSRRVSGVPRLN